jgi:FtsH-binding integral membrane protein
MIDYPALVFALCLVVLWLSAQTGAYLGRRRVKLGEDERADLSVILTSALTLLGLIIGFTFSMSITRYDQRKNYEAAEANAIGTEFARAGLLPTTEGTRVRELLRTYLHQRVLFYTTRDARQLQQIDVFTAHLQTDLWSAVQDRASAQPTPIVALIVSGMNDVLNSQAYTRASWWNRIPIAAWVLMVAIAICCDCLIGYTERQHGGELRRFLLLPLIVSFSFFLIADIDSPRGGVIRVHPQNLESLACSLQVR